MKTETKIKMTTKTTMKTTTARIAVALAFGAAFWLGAAAPQVRAQTDKFDEALQTEFTTGMSGDEAALKRALARAEKILATSPADAETLVWHGSATLAEAGKAFQSGNFREGAEFWKKGLSEMDKAVELAPDSFAVRMVRGSTAANAARKFPDPSVAKELREKAANDYEKILTLTDETAKKALPRVRERVLNGLIEIYEKLGDKAKAETHRRRLAQSQ